jgi:GTP-binding protein HflX
MEKLYETDEKIEKIVLVGVNTDDEEEMQDSLDELEELVKTAGGECVARLLQNREKLHPGTYLGKGKLEELLVIVQELQADAIVCDDELSPAQLKNLEDSLHIKIMDRTQVILDIFAKRATTKEGKIQVELAQLKYRAVRLVGMGKILSRLGGGIGTVDPGKKSWKWTGD